MHMNKEKLKKLLQQALYERETPFYPLDGFGEKEFNMTDEDGKEFKQTMTVFAAEMHDFSIEFKNNDKFFVYALCGIPNAEGQIEEIKFKPAMEMSLKRTVQIMNHVEKVKDATFFEIQFTRILMKFKSIREHAIEEALVRALYLQDKHIEVMEVL